MARCSCRWRNVLICACSPLLALILLFLYVGVMVCLRMTHTDTSPGSVHFVASGIIHNESFPPLPTTFWKLHEDAYWNNVQLATDRHFNPILHPRNNRTGFDSSTFDGSHLGQIFSEVTGLDSMKRNFDKLPQLMQDFVRHMNRRDYPVINQPGAVCGAGARDEKEPPLLLLAIKTTELNFKSRQAIRQTWGQEGWVEGQDSKRNGGRGDGAYIRRVFLLGKDNPEELGMDLSEMLRKEAEHYGDILQWDFSETFFNLTLKDVLFWSWFSRYCDQTLFVFKGDDDVFVNTPKMITYLQEQMRKPQARGIINDFMVGDVIGRAVPDRVDKSKYFVPDSFYNGMYSAYAGGGGVVYSGLLAKRLHTISQRVHLFPIDDVFVGMCMVRLNAHPIHNPAFLTFDFPGKEEKEKCVYHTILLVHKRSPNQIIDLWDDMKKTHTQCWDVPLRGD